MQNLLRKGTAGFAVAAVSALLFIGSAKADYLQGHYLYSGWNYNTSTLSDSHWCFGTWSWQHKVSTWFNFNGTTGYFTSSKHYAGWEDNPYQVFWHQFQAFDNYGEFDDAWGGESNIVTVERTWYPSGTYESDGSSNPVFVRSMFHPDPYEYCLPDSYHLLYGY